ncbi:MAG: DNA-3-methyladenine glycosylase 2 family protein [Caulobacterales bacterium]
MVLTDDARHAALEARDRRFDGAFFTGVTSTGIYCRCVCPARTPKRENRRFFPSAAAAERAGFRPCLVCRPEAAPGFAPIDAGERLAAGALRAIEAGALEERGIEALAHELGVSDRHLRRVLLRTHGASPVALAQTHRLLSAKRLLSETGLSITEVAFAAGFSSLRRFNALFQERYGMAPSRVRARQGAAKAARDAITLRLSARGVFDVAGAIAFVEGRALEGIESVTGARYRRTLRMGKGAPFLVRMDFDAGGVELSFAPDQLGAVRGMIATARRAFDLDADVVAIDAHLARCGLLAGDVEHEPGVRLTGGLDAFEIAMRAVLGQQVSVAAGRGLCVRLAQACGDPVADDLGLSLVFPTAAQVSGLGVDGIAALGMPRARAEAVFVLASAVHEGTLMLSPGVRASEGLLALKGIGPWTASYVALRGLGDQDAFPAGDVALQAASGLDARALERASQAWRPYRGYAAMRLWRRAARMKRSAG